MVPRSEALGSKIYRSRFVYKYKKAIGSIPARGKARWCVQDFMRDSSMQHETFAPVCRLETFRYCCAYAAKHDLEMAHIDINNAFCTAPLETPQYVELPDDLGKDYPDQVCKVTKALYGFDFSPRAFNQHLDKFMRSQGCLPQDADPCLYVRSNELGRLYVLWWVDAAIIIGDGPAVQQFRKAINKAEGGQFKVRDYGEPTAFLGLEIERNRAARSLLLHQQQYIRSMVERYDIDVTHPVPTPFALGVKLPAYDPEMATVDSTEYRSIVGSLQYAAVDSRPDIAFQVMSLARQLSAANVVHLEYAKRTLAYLSQTERDGCAYDGRLDTPQPEAYSDADWAAATNRRSVTGYIFMYQGGPISWKSQMQKSVAHSTSDAEIRALSETGRP